MAQDIRRMCKLMLRGEEQNQVHRRKGSDDLLLSEERDACVNAETVRVLISRELAQWVSNDRFPDVLELKLTPFGQAYAYQVQGSTTRLYSVANQHSLGF